MNVSPTDNTIVTIGDINYLWGIFMLIASARESGMEEPFLADVKNTPQDFSNADGKIKDSLFGS